VQSVSIPSDQREPFYTSLAQFGQHFPFVTKSTLVVQAVIEAAQAAAPTAGDARPTPTGSADRPTRTDLYVVLS
jgi:hypothetical protein